MSDENPAAFRIQIAVDGSDHALAATQLVRDLHLPLDSEITILGVLAPGRPPGKSRLQAASVEAEKIFEEDSVRPTTKLLHGHAAKRLIRYGNENRPDLMAIGAMHCVYDRGIRVPAEMSIVGFDDITFAQFTQPALTTVAIPRSQIGSTAFQALSAMQSDPDKSGAEYRVNTSLITRNSTAPVPGKR